MRQNSPNGRRPRGRHQGGSGNNNGNPQGNNNGGGSRPRSAAALRYQTFDSNCNDLRVRGNAWQVHEKYLALARDALGSGDRVAEQNYLQHAEHYYRIIEAINEATAAEQHQRQSSNGFAAQPETPAGYYGNSAAAPAPADAQAGQTASTQDPAQPSAPVMAQAEVTRKTIPSALYTPEEVQEHQNSADALVARG